MTCSGSLRAVALTALTTCLLVGPPAHADESAAETAAARSLAVEGIKLADAGDCNHAVDKLTRAEALHHAPTILGRLGECQIALGKIVQGTENLQRVVREPLETGAPDSFKDAQTRARKVLDAALPRIAKLTIIVQPPGAHAKVTLDGQAVPDALIGAEQPADPGSHRLEASADGYTPASQSVTLSDGGSQTVTLALEQGQGAAPVPVPVAPVPTQAPPPANPPPSGAPTAADHGGGGGSTAGIILVAVGGAGLVAGAVTGIMAKSKTSDLEGQCPDHKCPPAAHDQLASANSLATISTVAFGVGVVGLGLGTYLLVSAGGSKESAVSVAPRHPRHAEVRAWVGLGSAGLSGAF